MDQNSKSNYELVNQEFSVSKKEDGENIFMQKNQNKLNYGKQQINTENFIQQLLQVKRQSSSNLIGASISPSSSFMASVPYLADIDYLKSFSSLHDVSTDFTILDFTKDKKLSTIYFDNPDKLKNLLSQVESIRSQSLGRQAFQDYSTVLNQEWASQINQQYPRSSNTLNNQLLLIKIPQDLSQNQLSLIVKIIKLSKIDGIIVESIQNQSLNFKQKVCSLFNNIKFQETQKPQKQERAQKLYSNISNHNKVLFHLFQNLGPDMIIVSSGNFNNNGNIVLNKIKSGASIVLINGLTNPFQFKQIKRELIHEIRKQGIHSLESVRGRKCIHEDNN